MNFYRRKLPHLQVHGGEYFVTFRLKGSLPKHVIRELKEEQEKFRQKLKKKTVSRSEREAFMRQVFLRYDESLDLCETGPVWLKNLAVAEAVQEAIHYRDGNQYDLYAYCIMSNHVHMVFRHLTSQKDVVVDEKYVISNILYGLKRYSAIRSNKIVGRKGSFWQEESFDRFIRDDNELERVIKYTLYNPVKISLTEDWQDWSFTYCKPDFLETFT